MSTAIFQALLTLQTVRTGFEQILFALGLFELTQVFALWFGKKFANTSRKAFLPLALAIIRLEVGLNGLTNDARIERVHLWLQIAELICFVRSCYYKYGYQSVGIVRLIKNDPQEFIITTIVAALTAWSVQLYMA
jgi:hypothetical protein